MNNKGQTLVEFILVVPIILLIFIALVDVGNIYIKKYDLSNDLSTVSELYENNEKQQLLAFVANEEITYKEEENGSFIKIILEKKVPINAPILTNILGKNFKITVSKNIYKEETNE